jgi:predicted  nucleic acid-binding Zn-ribbon protein
MKAYQGFRIKELDEQLKSLRELIENVKGQMEQQEPRMKALEQMMESWGKQMFAALEQVKRHEEILQPTMDS